MPLAENTGNNYYKDIFGYPAEEMKKLGRFSLFELADPNLISFLKTREATGVAKGELTGIRKNGERFLCEVSSAVFIDENGQTRTSVSLIDISERRAIEKQIF